MSGAPGDANGFRPLNEGLVAEQQLSDQWELVRQNDYREAK